MTALVADASSAVQCAQKMQKQEEQKVQKVSQANFSNQPYTRPASAVVQCDANNNSIQQEVRAQSPYESGSVASPPVLAVCSLPPSIFRPTPVAAVQSGQQHQEECRSNEDKGASGEEKCEAAQEEEMRQMITRIENELVEMRLKEHQQQLSQPESSGYNHSSGEEEKRVGQAEEEQDSSKIQSPLVESTCTTGSAFRRVQAPKPPEQQEPSQAQRQAKQAIAQQGLLFPKQTLAPTEEESEEDPARMAAYQQRPASSSSYNHQQQSAILENLFNDMQGRLHPLHLPCNK